MYPNSPNSPWSSGLSDIPTCCLTLWCPCVTFGRVAEILDKGSLSCLAQGALYTLMGMGMACLYSCCYRGKMREQYSLEDRPCGDCLVHLCCETCALCQESRLSHVHRVAWKCGEADSWN